MDHQGQEMLDVLQSKVDALLSEHPDDPIDILMMRAALAGTTFGADCLEGFLRVDLATRFSLPKK